MCNLESRIKIQLFFSKSYYSKIWKESYRSANKFQFALNLCVPHIAHFSNSQFCSWILKTLAICSGNRLQQFCSPKHLPPSHNMSWRDQPSQISLQVPICPHTSVLQKSWGITFSDFLQLSFLNPYFSSISDWVGSYSYSKYLILHNS